MNIMFFLTPKAVCTCLREDFSIRQAMVKMEKTSFTSLPILSKSGKYLGTLTEGDLLWALKNDCGLDLHKAEGRNIMDITHRCDNAPVPADTAIEELLGKAIDQNFVPVIDDKDDFIGLIARKAIVQYFIERLPDFADQDE